MGSSFQDALAQYNSLKDNGLLQAYDDLKIENVKLERIFNDCFNLVSCTTVDSMIDYCIKRLLDSFIPECTVFFLMHPRKKILQHYFYDRMKKEEREISAKNYDLLKDFFNSGEQDTDFRIIAEKVGIASFTKDFLELPPEIIIPLSGIGGVFGVVILSIKTVGDQYSEKEIKYIQRLFSFLSITIQNGLLYESSITDPKTNLFTYDYFLTRVDDAIAIANRYKRNGGLIMIDIDFFKHFNDTYGHLAGDKVLVALSETLLKTVRHEDCVCRFGGEEFAILLPEASEVTLFQVAERIRKLVSEISIKEKNEILKITISIGACIISSYEGITPQIVINKADQALYYSKEHGRNRTTMYKLGLLDRAKIQLDLYQKYGKAIEIF